MSNEAEFLVLSKARRAVFSKQHRGFLAEVGRELARLGKPFSHSTITRTWYGEFLRPNQLVIQVLEEQYQIYLAKGTTTGVDRLRELSGRVSPAGAVA